MKKGFLQHTLESDAPRSDIQAESEVGLDPRRSFFPGFHYSVSLLHLPQIAYASREIQYCLAVKAMAWMKAGTKYKRSGNCNMVRCVESLPGCRKTRRWEMALEALRPLKELLAFEKGVEETKEM